MKHWITFAAALCLPIKSYAHGDHLLLEDGKYCREFTKEIRIGSRKEQGYGIACQQPDGSWKIISDSEFDNPQTRHKDRRQKDENIVVIERKVYVPSYGFHIGIGGDHHYHHRYRKYPHGWRSGKWYRSGLKHKRAKHPHGWKYRRGNSYSHLTVKSRKH